MASTEYEAADDLFRKLSDCFAAAPVVPAVCHGEVEKLDAGDEPDDPSDGDGEQEAKAS